MNKARLSATIVSLTLTLSGWAIAQTEQSGSKKWFEPLEHGFRVAHVSVDLSNRKSSFEGIAHYNDLYDGEKELGRFGNYSISDSGRFAVWEDQSPAAREYDGRLLLYDRLTGKIRDVTRRPYALPRDFEWDEPAEKLTVTFYPNDKNKRPTPSVVNLIQDSSRKAK